MNVALSGLEKSEKQCQHNQSSSSTSQDRYKQPPLTSLSEQHECNVFKESNIIERNKPTLFYRHKSASVEDINTNGKSTNNKKMKWFHLPKSLKRHESTPPLTPSQKIGFGGLKAGTVEPPDPPRKLSLILDPSFTQQFNEDQRLNRNSVSLSHTDFEKLCIHDVDESACFTTPLIKESRKPGLKIVLPSLKSRKRLSNQAGSGPPTPTSAHSESSSITSAASSIRSFSYCDDKYIFSTVFTEDSHELVMDFRNIKPRSTPLLRQVSLNSDTKALYEWQNQLLLSLEQSIFPLQNTVPQSEDIKSKNSAVRKFIINEFFSTEVTYWNQLNYTKVMHCEPFHLAVKRNSPFIVLNDVDGYANLKDLLWFSSHLILKLKQQSSTGDIHIGSAFRELAEYMVVFLRCALDYPVNKKILDRRIGAKGYALYNEKLLLRRETREFTLEDYLIIPIQRIARYELLLADLQKHTEPTHPDAENIRIARYIVHSLASAMNRVQN